MILLKILGIISLAILATAIVFLFVPVHIQLIGDNTNKISIYGRILFVKFSSKGKKQKNGSPMQHEKLFGVDRITPKTIRPVLAGIRNLLNRLLWLLGKCRVHRLCIHYTVADEDAAVAAIEYGSISTAIYSLAGLVNDKMRLDADAMDVKVFCDFHRVISTYSLNIHISFRVIWGLLAVLTWMYQKNKK